jgi:hypothetical protein
MPRRDHSGVVEQPHGSRREDPVVLAVVICTYVPPGTLEQAARLARDWVIDHLGRDADDRALPVGPPTS